MESSISKNHPPATYPDRMLSPVSIYALLPPARFEFDLYLKPVADDCRFLYAAASNQPRLEDLERLLQRGTKTLYIRRDQLREFNESLEQLLVSDAEISGLARLEIAKEAAKATFAEAWCRPATDALVETATKLADRMIDACRATDDLRDQLSSLLEHDGSTFSHVTNVSVYGVLLAMELGITDTPTLNEIGIAGLLHDIGKRFIQPDILRKPGALTPEERAAIERHPTRGFEELCKRSDMTQGQLSMIYQHHERLDGSGYPVRAVESEIHWMAKLCAVVDVFDALTGRRAYRKPASAEEALSFLEQKSGTQFDAEMVRCWKSVFMGSAIRN